MKKYKYSIRVHAGIMSYSKYSHTKKGAVKIARDIKKYSFFPAKVKIRKLR